ncbi:hypothetical protein L228DRAFT_284636 [Xylona heveae TC161]|uniref:Uncharacterized protein n=1 Tax=Xylona heveae (strain CBS 132557 / TC161) TaxID=1328760 RepID=A0A165F881_XYLHT|nr:hypothetical protein L228DRAFT_284636 [Xylona heveae TC161]KZF20691.1 hypothetical protein L228DRAFT_284636 [Xylona heveae TC161]
MSAASYKYIISRRVDPVFALAIGVAAAGVRIRREEKEKGHDGWQALALGMRRIGVSESFRRQLGLDAPPTKTVGVE